ncbi:MAG: phenylalanine--tRNA ligase subunit alpha, partial [Alloprevotella tannerae]|nr:phenylalanine--tRNA ligase subunit alpha [Alloprevotella tannerae]
MLEKIQALFAQIEDLHAKNLEELEALRIKFLSKKGCLNDLMSEFRNVSGEQKREVGMKLNELKRNLQDKLNTLRQELAVQEDEQDDLDLTRTPYPIPLGSRHPISIVKQRLVDIFSRMGFTMADGPEVEDDWHVFSSMNFADDHPARDMQDT